MVIKRRIIVQGNKNDVNKEMKKIATSKEIITVEMINENPQKYYGVNVKYECQNHETKWKIFSSDGEKIYLIASDYISTKYIPCQNDDRLKYIVSFENIARHYKNILGKENAEPVKYMLDKIIWKYFGGFVNTKYAEYATGGPTLELLIESYNKKYWKNYMYKLIDDDRTTGYLISANGGITWEIHNINIMLSIDDGLYVISNEEKAYGYWLSSFSNTHHRYYLYCVVYDGCISCAEKYVRTLGFRPVICLKPGVSIKKLSDGTYELVL